MIIDGQRSNARYYLVLSISVIIFGCGLITLPLLFSEQGTILNQSFQIGGGMITSFFTFPLRFYLKLRNKVFALRMI